MARDPQPAPRGGEQHDGSRAVAGTRRARRQDDEHPDDRALDRLADRGPSRVGVEGAMRARDVSRPTAADRAAAATPSGRRSR